MKQSMQIGGQTRTWTEIPGDPATAIMFLHGSRQSGAVARNFTNRQFEGLGPTVLYPDGHHHHFNDLRTGLQERARTDNIDDVAFLSALCARFDRVIGCGFSNGGQMLLRMLFDAPRTLHAAALFGASMPTPSNTLLAAGEFTPTPILAVQGTADPLVPFTGGVAGLGDMNRGETRSAIDSAAYLAGLNGSHDYTVEEHDGFAVHTFTGGEPVRLVAVAGMGHLVPVDKQLDARLGPGTDLFTGAELLTAFLAGGAGERTR